MALNEQIMEYTQHLRQGRIQVAYKGILDFLGKLRSEFIKKYPHYNVSGIYQGYMDMSYFSFSTKSLNEKGIKIAIVYLHEKGSFEVWLSARNRDIAKRYASALFDKISGNAEVFHDVRNPDAMIESVLTTAPDFDDQSSLMDTISQGVEKFLMTIIDPL